MDNGEGLAFSFSVITDFDAHIAREIKGYDILDSIVTGIADAVMEDGTNVYDIGCSTGRLMNTLARSLQAEDDESRRRNVRFIGFEPNSNFTKSFVPANRSVTVRKQAVTPGTRFSNASLVLSIFTLQFLPIHERSAVLRQIYEGLNHNGVFIWAEKVLASNVKIETLLNGQHIDFKRLGSSAEDILNKDRRLRAIMHPLTMKENNRMLNEAGFTCYEVFWRVNNFMATIAVKT